MHRCGIICIVVDGRRLPGSAGLVLHEGVAHLDPAAAVFEAMLAGWAVQQRARCLKPATIRGRLELVCRLATFANQYPWQWQAADVDAFANTLRYASPLHAVTPVRGHQDVTPRSET